MTYQIIPIVILLYILSGLFTKPLFGKKNEWYAIALFNKVLFVLNGNKILALIPMPWPFRRIKLKTQVREYEQPGKTYTAAVKDEFPNQTRRIMTVTEMIDIPIKKQYPLKVTVMLSDSYYITIIFDATIIVFNLKLLLPRIEDYIIYAEQEFGDVVKPWANQKQTIRTIRKVNIENVKTAICFTVDKKDYNLLEYLNEVKFIPNGFYIDEVSLDLGFSKEADEFFKLQRLKEDATAKKELAIENEKTRVIERETTEKDDAVIADGLKKKLQPITDHQKTVIDAEFAGKANVAEKYGGKITTLIINEGDKGKKDDSSIHEVTAQLIAGSIRSSNQPATSAA